MLDQMVLAGEAIVSLARAVLDRAVAEDGVVDACLVALQVCETGKRLAAVVAAKGLCGSSRREEGLLVWCDSCRGMKISWYKASRGSAKLTWTERTASLGPSRRR